MNIEELHSVIRQKKSYLCVGLDSDLNRIPQHLGSDIKSLIEFNRNIIESTSGHAVAYKINTAFYEQYGAEGWSAMEETLNLIPQDCFTIADAKRGDIGNTGKMYAKAFLERMRFDSITVSPYMGRDSVEPFFIEGKTVIVLGLTSNAGSADFQYLSSDNSPLYEHVLKKTSGWGTPQNLMFVVGATRADRMDHIRSIIPDYDLLVPGVGAQGGSLLDVMRHGVTNSGKLLVNSSRGIIYASDGEDYAEAAGREAELLQKQMMQFI